MAANPDLLALLRGRKTGYFSGEELSQQLDVSRSAIWKQVHQLEKAGYVIEAVPHLGYRLLSAPDLLLPAEIRDNLVSKEFGQTLYCYHETTSTNDRALELAQGQAPQGTLVTAEFQSQGRGRRERSWLSKTHSNLLFSVIFRPPWIAEQAALITLLVGVAVAQGIRQTTGLEPSIKWPNDILVQQTKVAGILTEMQAQADRIQYVVSGVGINVNTAPGGLLRYPAASLAKLAGKPLLRLPLLGAILMEIERLYYAAIKNGVQVILDEWAQWSFMTGTWVEVEQPSGEKWEGMVLGLDEGGALLLRLENGFTKRLTSGEVNRMRSATDRG